MKNFNILCSMEKSEFKEEGVWGGPQEPMSKGELSKKGRGGIGQFENLKGAGVCQERVGFSGGGGDSQMHTMYTFVITNRS